MKERNINERTDIERTPDGDDSQFSYRELLERDLGPNYIGKWGYMRKEYLENYREELYSEYVLDGTLNEHLHQVTCEASKMFDLLVTQMREREGLREDLKNTDFMAWVGAMENIRNRAEEVVRHDLIYV